MLCHVEDPKGDHDFDNHPHGHSMLGTLEVQAVPFWVLCRDLGSDSWYRNYIGEFRSALLARASGENC